MPTLMRWWEALRAPEVAKWQKKYRVDWDATDGRNGGAQQTVWDKSMEMERFNGKAKEIKVLQLGFWTWRRHLSGSVSLWSGLGQRTSAFQGRSVECCAGISSTRGVYSRRMCGRAAHDHHGHPARVQVELLAPAYCFTRRAERGHKK